MKEVRTMAKFFKSNPFYRTKAWMHKRFEVLELDHYECQYCKAKGKYKRATHVHHVKELKEYPELALEIWYIDEKGQRKRQLVSCCRECHETEGHPDRLNKTEATEPLTAERW